MATVAEARIVIQAVDEASGRIRGVTGELGNIVQQMKHAQDATGPVASAFGMLTGALGNIFQIASGIIAAQVFGRIAQGITSMTGQALAAAANFQLLQIQMQGLVALQIADEIERTSGAAADMAAAMQQATGPASALVEWITDFAIKTPFTVQSLTEMTRGFLAIGMGVEPTKRLTGALASMAAGLGLSQWQLERVVANIQQTGRSMKITERDIREFGNAGIPVNRVLDAMARQLGITRLEALEFAKSGEAGVAAFVEGIQAVAEKDFPDALDNISKTWSVAASNIKDAIESLFGKEVLGPIVEKAAGIISDFINNILENREAFTAIGKALAGAFEFLGNRIGPLFSAMRGLIDTILEMVGIDISRFSLREFILDTALFIGDLLVKATEFATWLKDTLPGAAQTAVDFLQPVINAVGNLATAFIEQFPIMQETGQKLIDWLSNAFGIVGPQLIESLTGAINSLAGIWREHGDTIMAIIGFAFKMIVATVSGALTLAGGIIDAGLQLVRGIFDFFSAALQGDWDKAWQIVSDTLTAAWNTIVQAVETFLDLVLSIVGTNLEEFRIQWSENWEAVKLLVTTVWENITTAIDEKIQAIKTAITTGIQEIQTAWSTIWEDIKLLVTTVWKNIQTAVSEKIQAVRDNITTRVQEIQTGWSTAWEGIKQLAITIWNNIQTVIAEKIQAVKDKITEVLIALDPEWKEHWETIREDVILIWNTIKERISEKIQAVRDDIIAKIEELKNTWNTIWEDVKQLVITIWNNIQTVIAEKVQAIRDNIIAKIEELKKTWNTIWSNIKIEVINIWSDIVIAVGKKIQAVRDDVTAKIEELKKTWSTIWDDISKKVSDIWKDILKAVLPLLADLFNAVTGKVQEIMDWIGGIFDKFVALGKSIIDGLTEGVMAAATVLLDAVVAAMIAALEAAKRALGIGSPSTVFRDAVGAQMMAGMALGITSAAGMVESALSGVVGGLVPRAAAVPAFAGAGGAIGGGTIIRRELQTATGAQIHFAPGSVVIQNGMDMAKFQSMLRQAVRG